MDIGLFLDQGNKHRDVRVWKNTSGNRVLLLVVLAAIILISGYAGATARIAAASTHSPTLPLAVIPINLQVLVTTGSARNDNANQDLTAKADALYRDTQAHDRVSIYCSACHGSVKVIHPAITAQSNEHSIQVLVRAISSVDCVVCHTEKPLEAFWHFDNDG